MRKMNFKKIKPDKILEYVFLGLTFFGIVFSLNYTINNFDNPTMVNVYLVIPFILFLSPYLFFSLFALKKVESKMEVVPRILRDIVDNVDSGMDLISSIKITVNNEYGVLNQDIEKLSNQLSWGIDFETALLNFAKNIGSNSLKKDFILIIEARKVGGHIDKLLRELSVKISNEILRNKERKSNLASNTFTGYISFMIFILIIILVYNNLFLGLGATMAQQSATEGSMMSSNANAGSDAIMKQYLTLLMLLSYELAILSGFLFGLMQSNNIISGAPHVVMLILITFVGFFFFI